MNTDLADEAIHYHMKAVRSKQTLIKRWRALKLPGRLYWRNRVNWRDWDSKAFACYREGTVRTWYYTMEALKADLADMEAQHPGGDQPQEEA